MEIAKPDDARFTCGHGAPPRKSTLRVGWADGAYVARRWPRPRPRRAPRRARGPERGEWRRQSRAKPKRGCLGRAAAARGRARAPLARAAAPHHAHIAQRPEALRQRGHRVPRPRGVAPVPRAPRRRRERVARDSRKAGHRARRRGRRREPGASHARLPALHVAHAGGQEGDRCCRKNPGVRRAKHGTRQPVAEQSRAGAGPFFGGGARRREPIGTVRTPVSCLSLCTPEFRVSARRPRAFERVFGASSRLRAPIGSRVEPGASRASRAGGTAGAAGTRRERRRRSAFRDAGGAVALGRHTGGVRRGAGTRRGGGGEGRYDKARPSRRRPPDEYSSGRADIADIFVGGRRKKRVSEVSGGAGGCGARGGRRRRGRRDVL